MRNKFTGIHKHFPSLRLLLQCYFLQVLYFQVHSCSIFYRWIYQVSQFLPQISKPLSFLRFNPCEPKLIGGGSFILCISHEDSLFIYKQNCKGKFLNHCHTPQSYTVCRQQNHGKNKTAK